MNYFLKGFSKIFMIPLVPHKNGMAFLKKMYKHKQIYLKIILMYKQKFLINI